MRVILEIALGIVLAHFALRASARFTAWRATPKHLRGYKLKLISLDAPPVEPPSTHVYKPAVPGVQYDHEGVAINSVAGASRRAVPFLAWVGAAYFGVLLLLMLIGSLR